MALHHLAMMIPCTTCFDWKKKTEALDAAAHLAWNLCHCNSREWWPCTPMFGSIKPCPIGEILAMMSIKILTRPCELVTRHPFNSWANATAQPVVCLT